MLRDLDLVYLAGIVLTLAAQAMAVLTSNPAVAWFAGAAAAWAVGTGIVLYVERRRE